MSKIDEKLKTAIREIVDDELEEISTSGAAGGYLTPNAFTGPNGKPPVKKGVNKDDFKPKSFGEDYQFEGKTPGQKIAKAITEINKQITVIEKVTAATKRLKNESNAGMWKRTSKTMTQLENKLLKVAQQIREMR